MIAEEDRTHQPAGQRLRRVLGSGTSWIRNALDEERVGQGYPREGIDAKKTEMRHTTPSAVDRQCLNGEQLRLASNTSKATANASLLPP
eukprot:6183968-Pleurochrysis_carterae.AAC.1